MKRGLSQRNLGVLIGIDPSSASPRINQYETDKYLPDYRIAERLAACLDVPVPYLYAEDDQLATLLLVFGTLSARQQARVLKVVQGFSAG